MYHLSNLIFGGLSDAGDRFLYPQRRELLYGNIVKCNSAETSTSSRSQNMCDFGILDINRLFDTNGFYIVFFKKSIRSFKNAPSLSEHFYE